MLVKSIEVRKVYQWLVINLLRPRCGLCAGSAHRLAGICAGCIADLPTLTGPVCRCGLPLDIGRDLSAVADCQPAASSCPTPARRKGAKSAHQPVDPADDDPLHGTADASLAPLCGRCLNNPPPFLGVQTLWRYTAPVDQLINNWKHHRQLAAERILLGQAQASLPLLPYVDAVIAMPLHWQRQAWRGFNQAARLAERVARQQGLAHLPALRQQQRHQQQGASRQRRLAKHSTAFRCIAPVSGLHLLLVDDVVTTTASCRAASACLLAAGAASVSVLALARTLPADCT